MLDKLISKLPMPALVAGLGAAISIGLLAWLNTLSRDLLWLMAPFGATVVLLFAVPQSPLAQPRNVIGGHLLTAVIGLLALQFLGVSPWSMALASGLAVSLMMITKTTHPPAGANPVLILMTAPSWMFLLNPVATGALALVLVGIGYHKFVTGQAYPAKQG